MIKIDIPSGKANAPTSAVLLALGRARAPTKNQEASTIKETPAIKLATKSFKQ